MAISQRLITFGIAAALLAGSASVTAAGKAPAKPETDRVIEYKSVEGGALKLHVFLPPEWKVTDRRPAALFFFGGGWVSGTPSQFFPQAAHLASRGMVGISAQYRTKGSHKTSPKECVEDGKSAVRWLRGHAAEPGIAIKYFPPQHLFVEGAREAGIGPLAEGPPVCPHDTRMACPSVAVQQPFD